MSPAQADSACDARADGLRHSGREHSPKRQIDIGDQPHCPGRDQGVGARRARGRRRDDRRSSRSKAGLARPTVSTTLSKLAKTGEIQKAERGYQLTSAS